MLQRAKEVTRAGPFTHIEYARWADDVVILVDGHRKWKRLVKIVITGLLEELGKLDVQLNREKSRLVNMEWGNTFTFLGFEFRRVKTRKGNGVCKLWAYSSASGCMLAGIPIYRRSPLITSINLIIPMAITA